MTLVSRFDPWLPPLALMGVIFYLSAQPDLSSGLGTWDYVLRKGAHFTEYALLTFLLWRALRTLVDGRRAIAAAFAVTVLYAISDELHQTFVPTRHGALLDVLIDTTAAGVMALLILRRTGRPARAA